MGLRKSFKKIDWYKEFNIAISFALVIIGIGMVIGGAFLSFHATKTFWIGMHNVDLSYNTMIWVNDLNKENIDEKLGLGFRNYRNVFDKTNQGDVIPYTDGYILGGNQQEASFIMLPLFVGIFFSGIVFMLFGFLNYIFFLRKMEFKYKLKGVIK